MTLKRRAFERGHKIANPIPFEKRLFKCLLCKDFKYMPELWERGICLRCKDERIGEVDQSPSQPTVEGLGPVSASVGEDVRSVAENNATEQSGRDENCGSQGDERGPRIDQGEIG